METVLAGLANKICFITGKEVEPPDELLIWTRQWPATDQGATSSVLQISDSTHYKSKPAAAICPSAPLLPSSRNSSSNVIGCQMVRPQHDNRCQKLKMLENSELCSANCSSVSESECIISLVEVISSEIQATRRSHSVRRNPQVAA